MTSLVFKFSRVGGGGGGGGQDPRPPFKFRNMLYIYFTSNTTQHKPLVQREVFKIESQNKGILLLFCDRWAIILLAKDLLHHFHTII